LVEACLDRGMKVVSADIDADDLRAVVASYDSDDVIAHPVNVTVQAEVDGLADAAYEASSSA
jgi:hypothetical protein